MHKKIIIVTENKALFEKELENAGINTEGIKVTLASDISETEHAIKYHEPWHIVFDEGIRPRLLNEVIREATIVSNKIRRRRKPELLLFGEALCTSLPHGIHGCVTAPKLIEMAKKLSSS